MNRCLKQILVSVTLVVAAAFQSQAQYYELANQLPSLISPALSGSMRYKGYAEAGFTGGFTDNKANFMSFSTSQGFQYSDWFFMGAGLGIDVTFRNNDLRSDLSSDRRRYLTNNANFYLKPSAGVRIPVNSKNPRQAVNIGLTYQLITSNNNLTWYGGNSLTLNSIGATIGYEW